MLLGRQPNNTYTAALLVLGNLTLKQLVNVPTHCCCHTLDWLIMNHATDVLDLTVTDIFLSDHFVISFDLSLKRPGRVAMKVMSRNISLLTCMILGLMFIMYLSLPLSLILLTPSVCTKHVCASLSLSLILLTPSVCTKHVCASLPLSLILLTPSVSTKHACASLPLSLIRLTPQCLQNMFVPVFHSVSFGWPPQCVQNMFAPAAWPLCPSSYSHSDWPYVCSLDDSGSQTHQGWAAPSRTKMAWVWLLVNCTWGGLC